MAKDNEPEILDGNWRDTMLTPHVGPFNSLCLLLWVPFFFFYNFYVFWPALTGTIGLWVAETRGYTPLGALRAIRLSIFGPERPARRANRFRRWGMGEIK